MEKINARELKDLFIEIKYGNKIAFEKLYLIDKEKLPNRNESSWLYSITKNETEEKYIMMK